YLCKVLALKITLGFLPQCPRLLDRHPENLLELRGIVRAAALSTRHPFDHLSRRGWPAEPRHETRAVQIRIHLCLEVDLGSRRHETQRIVERRVVANHRPKDHLVVPALRPAEPARHPGIDKDRDPL